MNRRTSSSCRPRKATKSKNKSPEIRINKSQPKKNKKNTRQNSDNTTNKCTDNTANKPNTLKKVKT